MKLKNMPSLDSVQYFAKKYPELDYSAIEACLFLLGVSSELSSAMDTHFSRLGLSKGRFKLMMILLRHKDAPISPADLAQQCGVTRATMTGLLDTLENAGFIAREQNSDDRRGLAIKLTKQGESHMQSILPDHCRRTAALMQKLSIDERKQLVSLLGKVWEGIPFVRDS